MMAFLDNLENNIRSFPQKVALEFLEPPHLRTTYQELGGRIQRTAAYLRSLGIEPGDRVALQLPKCREFICLHLATLHLGAISIPLNPAYPPAEIAFFLRDSGARLFFCLHSSREQAGQILPELPALEKCVFLETSRPEHFELLLSEVHPAAPSLPPATALAGSTAVIIYTSGTTGRPKGAEITHANLSANLESLNTVWGWRPDDVLLHVLPIFHVHGLFVALFGSLNAGATTLLMREFDARKTLAALVERRCTVFMGVPTIHRRLLGAADANSFDLSHVRLITSGSDRLPDDVFRSFEETFGHTLLERYGMTETGMNLSNPLKGERRAGSVGLPLPAVEVRIVDQESGEILLDGQVGEVQVRGPHVFKGYWRQAEVTAEAFTEDGWFRTGDLGLRAPDGYITLKGRARDLIITGGMNVYPPEVERVITEHPKVAASAVIGFPDQEWGERVVAVVALLPGQTVTGEELIAFCRTRLAAYKAPKLVYFRDELPRNALGKVQKEELRREICL